MPTTVRTQHYILSGYFKISIHLNATKNNMPPPTIPPTILSARLQFSHPRLRQTFPRKNKYAQSNIKTPASSAMAP